MEITTTRAEAAEASQAEIEQTRRDLTHAREWLQSPSQMGWDTNQVIRWLVQCEIERQEKQ